MFWQMVEVHVLLVENTNNSGLFCLHHGLIGLRDFADFHVILTSNKHQSNEQIYGQHSVGGIGHGYQNEVVAS